MTSIPPLRQIRTVGRTSTAASLSENKPKILPRQKKLCALLYAALHRRVLIPPFGFIANFVLLKMQNGGHMTHNSRRNGKTKGNALAFPVHDRAESGSAFYVEFDLR